MNPDLLPYIGRYWAPILDNLNALLESTGIDYATVRLPLAAIALLSFFWLLIRVVRRRKTAKPAKQPTAVESAVTVGEPDRETAEDPVEDIDQKPSASLDDEPEVDYLVDTEPFDEPADAEVAADALSASFEAIEGIEPVLPEPVIDEVELGVVEPEEIEPEEVVEEVVEEPKLTLFQRLKQGLGKTRSGFVGKIESLLMGHSKIDDELFDDLEEALVTSDIGVQTAYALLEKTQGRVDKEGITDPRAIMDILRDEIKEILAMEGAPIDLSRTKPFVIMVVGVNGTGKTTTIGKMASLYQNQGYKVLMAAADTFRAAAIEQLEVWANRVGCDLIRQQQGSDPSAVAFDAIDAAQARGSDIVIIDTAGRLHTKTNLMNELGKVKRVVQKKIPDAPHETLLVLDATTGQNAINQAKEFNNATDLSGFVLTKLDGTAKGGCIVGIAGEFKLPIRFIGIGEKIDDLRPFEVDDFVKALF